MEFVSGEKISVFLKTVLSLSFIAAVGSAQAQWTVVNLNPQGASHSYAYGVSGGLQAGSADVGGVDHASLWSGTSASWVDLNPSGATESRAYGVRGGQQVGYALVGTSYHAVLWRGTVTSWVDLNPAGATESRAYSVNGGQQVGYAYVAGVSHAA